VLARCKSTDGYIGRVLICGTTMIKTSVDKLYIKMLPFKRYCSLLCADTFLYSLKANIKFTITSNQLVHWCGQLLLPQFAQQLGSFPIKDTSNTFIFNALCISTLLGGYVSISKSKEINTNKGVTIKSSYE
jgi:hypothetical protein